MLRNSDGFLACSQSTARNLQDVARSLALSPPEVHVIALDGDLRAEAPGRASDALGQVFERAGIPFDAEDKPGYVLCVSTLESRKNHLLLFHVWDMMIARRGLDQTPYLLCVGKPGYLFDAPQNFVKSRPHLESRIRFLEGIDDPSLASLYAGATFSVYPSFYEGWGLPVTESLCFGKAVASSNTSSLPEAGGKIAQYFDPYGVREAYQVIERLAFDEGHRKAIEARIAQSFKPRPWGAIASQVLDSAQAIKDRCGEVTDGPRSGIQQVAWSTLYAMRPTRPEGDNEAPSGEDIRLGDGWYRCEDWGVWTRSRRASMVFRLPEIIPGPVALYVQLKAPPGGRVNVRITARLTGEAHEIELADDEPRYVRVAFNENPGARLDQKFTLEASRLTDLGALTDNRDPLVVGCGLLQIGVCPDTDLSSRIATLEAMTFSRARPAARD
jgi:hypothetical protein